MAVTRTYEKEKNICRYIPHVPIGQRVLDLLYVHVYNAVNFVVELNKITVRL